MVKSGAISVGSIESRKQLAITFPAPRPTFSLAQCLPNMLRIATSDESIKFGPFYGQKLGRYPRHHDMEFYATQILPTPPLS